MIANKGNVDAEATSIYNRAFGSDPEFYAFFRTLESYSRSLGEQSVILLGMESDYLRYLRNVSPKDRRPPESNGQTDIK